MHDVIRDILVRDTMLKTFSNEFFHYMCALKVLDLSGNRCITSLPKNSHNGVTIRAQETQKVEIFAIRLYKTSLRYPFGSDIKSFAFASV
ncbi:hypothetical protein CFP56_026205 [Quercus suber]|uniref:Uncharacterized protein n=1 Tax=Quercus suber TaxID=58331 RepID=A0AAW0K302_QUESU